MTPPPVPGDGALLRAAFDAVKTGAVPLPDPINQVLASFLGAVPGDDFNPDNWAPGAHAELQRRTAHAVLALAEQRPTSPQITVTVDHEAGAVYVKIADGIVARTTIAGDAINADLDQDGRLLGVALLDIAQASKARPYAGLLRETIAAVQATQEFDTPGAEYQLDVARFVAAARLLAVLVTPIIP